MSAALDHQDPLDAGYSAVTGVASYSPFTTATVTTPEAPAATRTTTGRESKSPMLSPQQIDDELAANLYAWVPKASPPSSSSSVSTAQPDMPIYPEFPPHSELRGLYRFVLLLGSFCSWRRGIWRPEIVDEKSAQRVLGSFYKNGRLDSNFLPIIMQRLVDPDEVSGIVTETAMLLKTNDRYRQSIIQSWTAVDHMTRDSSHTAFTMLCAAAVIDTKVTMNGAWLKDNVNRIKAEYRRKALEVYDSIM